MVEHHKEFSPLLTNTIEEEFLENKSITILPEGQHGSLPSLPGFVILLGCAPIYVSVKRVATMLLCHLFCSQF